MRTYIFLVIFPGVLQFFFQNDKPIKTGSKARELTRVAI